jgi:hypothetical protein
MPNSLPLNASTPKVVPLTCLPRPGVHRKLIDAIRALLHILAGIARDHPEYFRPIGRRRASSSASINTLSGFTSSDNGSSSAYGSAGEGQLRYWTSEMCSKSPHLFDFVVTVRALLPLLFTLFSSVGPVPFEKLTGSLSFAVSTSSSAATAPSFSPPGSSKRSSPQSSPSPSALSAS